MSAPKKKSAPKKRATRGRSEEHRERRAPKESAPKERATRGRSEEHRERSATASAPKKSAPKKHATRRWSEEHRERSAPMESAPKERATRGRSEEHRERRATGEREARRAERSDHRGRVDARARDGEPEPHESAERQRRALSNLGGPIETRGESELASMLARAWERAATEPPDVLTHGFHSWPARMHWAIPRTILEALAPRTLVDPFCGGGTVLVEARVAGARALGVDLSPLARRVSEVKLDARDAEGRARLLAHAEAVAAASEARVRGRVPMQVALPTNETRWYAPHVLKELGGLLEEIRAIEEPADRRALEIVFSSILIKVSRQRADTAERATEKRIRKGLSTELFLRKTKELVARLGELEAVARGPLPRVLEGDARNLAQIAGERRFDLVLTSPPYGGTYDYATHHARRMAWLGLDDRALHRFELGARRSLMGADAARHWERDVDTMLAAMAAVVRRDGYVALVMGDAQIGEERVDVPPQLSRLAPRHGLRPTALASQARIDRVGQAPRREHIALLRRV